MRLPGALLALLVVLSAGCKKGQTTPGAAGPAAPAPHAVRIAAAADLRYALEEARVRFTADHPNTTLDITYGSSGSFYAQLTNRAPFDLFLSADIDYPQKLIEQNLAIKNSAFRYAQGAIVLWTPNGSKLDIQRLGWRALLDPAVQRIAIANPQHAPYGRAAEAALKHEQLWDAVHDKLVYGESISQAAQFVQSGSADAGIIALSLAVAPPMRDKGRYFRVPAEQYPPIEQGGVILAWAQDRPAAEAFVQFLTGAEGRAILDRYGLVSSSPVARRPAHETLKQVDFRTGVYLARLESHTTISPDGYLRNTITRNKTYGPGDTGGPPAVETREGQLTPSQVEELARLFKGWESLGRTYPAVADGGERVLIYGGIQVVGNLGLPEQVTQIEQRVRQLAATMRRTDRPAAPRATQSSEN